MPSAVSVSATRLMVLIQDCQPSTHRCQSGKVDRILQDPELRDGHRMSLWLVPSSMLPQRPSHPGRPSFVTLIL